MCCRRWKATNWYRSNCSEKPKNITRWWGVFCRLFSVDETKTKNHTLVHKSDVCVDIKVIHYFYFFVFFGWIFKFQATSALDSETERRILKELHESFENITTIVIAHRLSTIVDADRFVWLLCGSSSVFFFSDSFKCSSEFLFFVKEQLLKVELMTSCWELEDCIQTCGKDKFQLNQTEIIIQITRTPTSPTKSKKNPLPVFLMSKIN